MSTPFESWAVVEIMGHARFAGFVTEQSVGGCNFLRVDVPELPAIERDGRVILDAMPAYSKLFGQAAVFSLTPCDEASARKAAASFRSMPLPMVLDLSPSPRIEFATDEPPDDDNPYFDDLIADMPSAPNAPLDGSQNQDPDDPIKW